MASWTASRGFKTEDLAFNMLAAYYVLLTLLMHSYERRGDDWQKGFWSLITTRNLVSMLAHNILRLLHWPSTVPFEPACTMEDGIERHFGKLKTYRKCTGVLSTANSIQAGHYIHLMQSQGDLPKAQIFNVYAWLMYLIVSSYSNRRCLLNLCCSVFVAFCLSVFDTRKEFRHIISVCPYTIGILDIGRCFLLLNG